MGAMKPVLAVVHTRHSPCRCHEFFVREARALGWRAVRVAVEEMALHRAILARADLVAEHTDTYGGRGDLRPLVRHFVESVGGRLLGASAAAAQVCDDKIEARRRMEAAGIPVAPLARGRFPAVVKRPFEHGSRGIALVRDRAALERACRRWHADGTLLVERFVEGRELSVGLLEGGGRLLALPVVETLLPPGRTYGRARKWLDGAGPPIVAAALPARLDSRIRRLAERAFRALGLRDYARFDVRLSSDGTPCFLEANARPSVEEGTEFRVAAALAGYDGMRLMSLLLATRKRRTKR